MLPPLPQLIDNRFLPLTQDLNPLSPFPARDLAFGGLVHIKLLGLGCSREVPERLALSATFRLCQNLSHPQITHSISLNPRSGMLIRQWVHGFSLLDLLRKSPTFLPDELSLLLHSAPPILDLLASHHLQTPRSLADALFFEFSPSVDPLPILDLPPHSWPDFTLKIVPFHPIPPPIPSPLRKQHTQRLIRVSKEFPQRPIPATYPIALAELLYEFLGGQVTFNKQYRYSPLIALNESANASLLKNLQGHSSSSCQSLWRDLQLPPPPSFPSSLPPPPPTKYFPHPHTPRKLAQPSPQPASSLLLRPLNPGPLPIHLKFQPQFKFGRSRPSADYLTRFNPDQPSNLPRTERLGRVHALAEIHQSLICLRDGNGSTPSINGSFLNAVSLNHDTPTPLIGRSLLSLAHDFFLELIPLLHPPRRSLPFPRRPLPPLPSTTPLRGALLCSPLHPETPVAHSVWIFSEIGFTLDPSQNLFWDTRPNSLSPASFHYHASQFFLLNHSLPQSSLLLDHQPILPTQFLPIASGQIIQIGSTVYLAEIH